MTEFHIHTEERWKYRPLLGLIITLLVIFITWASLSNIEQHVRASGRIIPAGQAKIIQHLEGGVINSILIKEGQSVDKGQILFQISNQRAASGLEESKIGVDASKIRIARLKAEYDGLEDFEMDATSDNLKIIIKNEKDLFNARHEAFLEKINGYQERATQKRLKLEELNAQLTNLSAERSVAQDQFNINEKLRKSGAMSESRYLDSKGTLRNFDTRLDQVRKQIPVIEAELQETLKGIKEEEQQHKSEVLDEMNKIQVDLQQMEERIKGDYDEVGRTALTSPVKGIVNKIFMNTIGGVVRPGEPLAEIIPMDDNLIVEAQIKTKDRGLIWIGLPAAVRISAYDYATYGAIKGKVTEISADSFEDDHGNQFYRVRIALDSATVGKNNEPIYPGMTVEAHIISGEKSIMSSLLKPLLRLQQNALREP